MTEVILKKFENPDEVREFEKGRFEIIHLGVFSRASMAYYICTNCG